ncbi:response regulator transcription factor [Solirubrobacter taibaiensis]|nr:response regulator transcription factor [Solirubrobacter taibaiensis]
MPIRVVLGEDSLLVREGVKQLLDVDPEIDVIAAVGDLDSLRTVCRHERPNVVVTDIRMPPSNTDEGIRLAGELRDVQPEVGVVVLSQYADPIYALALLDRGSARRAYLLKERVHNRAELTAAIQAVATGGSLVDSKIVDALVAVRSQAASSPLNELTTREREVLAEIARGKSNMAIAESLFLTKRAVEKHINAIFLKLGLANAEDVSKRVAATLMLLAESGSVTHTADRH